MQSKMDDAEVFIRELKRYRQRLDRNALLTLRGQALSGDVEGARRGLERMLRREYQKYGMELSDTC